MGWVGAGGEGEQLDKTVVHSPTLEVFKLGTGKVEMVLAML